ncbi:MAG: BolA/IbaG family iron-sulfur metabolism protein [Sulfuricellaceae bacterium]
MDNPAPETVKTYIENALECDLVRTGEHGGRIMACIVSPVFRGKSMVQQHQLVYGALGEHMNDEIPTLSLRTYTPEDWAERGGLE